MQFKISASDSILSQPLRLDIQIDRTSLRVTPTPFGALIVLDGCAPTGELGGPALPSKLVRVALPLGAHSIELTAETMGIVPIGDAAMLPAPLQPARPGATRGQPLLSPCAPSDESELPRPERVRTLLERFHEPQVAPALPAPPFVPPRFELYKREAEQPRPLVRLESIEQRGMNTIAVLEINPVQLDAKGRLQLAIDIGVTLRYARSDQAASSGKADDGIARPKPITSRAQAERVTQSLRALVINPDAVIDLGPWFWPLLLEVDYLIITDNYGWDATTVTRGAAVSGDPVAHFQRLADWKRMRGLRSRVVTVSEIVNGRYGSFRRDTRDLQEVIRNFVKFAHSTWGVAWILLGGDLDIVPARQVLGYADGGLGRTTTNPPEVGQTFWTGSFMMVHIPGHSTTDSLFNADNGLAIPHDAADTSSATQRGWFFTTSDSYATRSANPTEFIRVNGPASEVDGSLIFAAHSNLIPTDLYYASLSGPSYGIAGSHDWDLGGAGVYGLHTDAGDAGGVEYEADVSVGRAPINSGAHAEAFVNKVIAYEQFRRPDGVALDERWARKILFGAANWGGRFGVGVGSANPPGDDQAFHDPTSPYTLIHTSSVLGVDAWRLLIQVSETDVRSSPFNSTASDASRGWRFARSATDHSASEVILPVPWGSFVIPIPTSWIVVYGPATELTPQLYLFDFTQADGSMADQEQLRTLIRTELPAFNEVQRLYEDEVDLTAAQLAAAPIDYLTTARMRARIDEGQHIVSLSGHGWWGGCCGYDLDTAENVHNGYHSYIAYADSCSTNEFDVDDAISERSLQNASGGAVAYVGNSRFSWIGVGDNFQRAFFHRLASTTHLGLAADSRCALLNEATGFWKRYNKWAIFALNLMGDPEMPVWNGAPQRFTARFARELDKRLPFEVQVTTRGFFGIELPLTGATVTVRQGQFFQQGVTDGAGRVALDIGGSALGDMDVVITHVQYVPAFERVEIVGPAWIRGTIYFISHQHVAPDATYIALDLSTPLQGSTRRAWYARKSFPDYGVILDAATDAYITQKEISFFVASVKALGTLERFRFGSQWLVTQPDLDLTHPHLLQPTLEPDLQLVAAASPVKVAATADAARNGGNGHPAVPQITPTNGAGRTTREEPEPSAAARDTSA